MRSGVRPLAHPHFKQAMIIVDDRAGFIAIDLTRFEWHPVTAVFCIEREPIVKAVAIEQRRLMEQELFNVTEQGVGGHYAPPVM